MTLTTQDGLVAAMAAGQTNVLHRVGTRTLVAGAWFQTLDVSGNPGAGTLAGTSTAAGVVPTDATQGCPNINAFTGANTGYLASVGFGANLGCRLRLADMLFKAGAYAFNASTSLASQPSYSSRVPGGDYGGTEIWIECVTAFTGTLSVAVTYTNQAGTAAHTTGTFSVGSALTVGRMIQLPLQAGDTGVQKIESVTATVASAGTFNVLVLRPLWQARVAATNSGGLNGPDQTDLPVLFTDSALMMQVASDTTAMPIFETVLGIVNG
jgi:hypothetical protein